MFFITDIEQKLFAPLAATKTFAIIASGLLALGLLPTIMVKVLFPQKTPSNLSSLVWINSLLLAVIGTVFFHVLLGMMLMLMVLGRATTLFLSEANHSALKTRLQRIFHWGFIVVALILLTKTWLPLQMNAPFVLQLGFIVLIFGMVLGPLKMLRRSYKNMLLFFLKYKKTFLMMPMMMIVFGTMTWLGFESIFFWMPKTLKLIGHEQSLLKSAPWQMGTKIFPGIQRTFMPNLDEGSYLYMPTTMPHASLNESHALLRQLHSALKEIPEVDLVVGKIGRVNSSLDSSTAFHDRNHHHL